MQLLLIVGVIVLLAAIAWWFRGSGPAQVVSPVGAPSAVAPVGTQPAEISTSPDDLSVDELYKAARSAMGENRMVAPPGNNALEYYLSILAKQPDDTGATDALRELFPFATGSAEDQINQGNFDEAGRIMALLAKADPSNYTLTILRSKLDAKKKQNDRDQQLQAQQAAAAAARTQAAAPATGAAAAPTGAPNSAADAVPPAAPTAAATPRPAEVARATPPPSAAPAPAPAQPVGETRDVRVISPPQPSYPPLAARNHQQGWVEVEFTVAADGSVQNARVVNATPARVFDKEALRAIEQAKFEPRLSKGEAVPATLRRRIEFKFGN